MRRDILAEVEEIEQQVERLEQRVNELTGRRAP
jgi:ubiquinone biosynthesis protein UbiJ